MKSFFKPEDASYYHEHQHVISIREANRLVEPFLATLKQENERLRAENTAFIEAGCGIDHELFGDVCSERDLLFTELTYLKTELKQEKRHLQEELTGLEGACLKPLREENERLRAELASLKEVIKQAPAVYMAKGYGHYDRWTRDETDLDGHATHTARLVRIEEIGK